MPTNLSLSTAKSWLIRLAFAILAYGALVTPARSSGLAVLDEFIQTTKNGRAEFIQTVTVPASRSGLAAKKKISVGTFEFMRPHRFKFTYVKPFAQTIVADGQMLWLYDVDLNQVTSRKLSTALAGSPVALFASASNMQALQAAFTLKQLPSSQDAQTTIIWILATPKNTDQSSDTGLLQSVKVGFKQTPAGVEIAAIEIIDSFGQTSRVEFENVKINTQLSNADFNFKVPAGVDLIKQ